MKTQEQQSNCHQHEHSTHEHGEHNCDSGNHIHPITENLKVAFFLNLTFTIIEFIGGWLTNSMAIMSDAVHDLGDTFGIGSALYFEKISTKKRDQTYSYGYKRFSSLSALINSIILLTGSIVILIETIPRLISPSEVHSQGMLGLAILGVVMNGLAVLKLKKGGNSLNQKAVMLHLLEDALGWVAVLIGSIIIYFTNWFWIDPLLSLGISLFVLYNAGKNLLSVFRIFLQAIPKDIDLDKIKNEVLKIRHVIGAHDCHLWSMDGQFHVLTIHAVVEEKMSLTSIVEIKKSIRTVLKKFNIHHATIEIEEKSEKCELENC